MNQLFGDQQKKKPRVHKEYSQVKKAKRKTKNKKQVIKQQEFVELTFPMNIKHLDNPNQQQQSNIEDFIDKHYKNYQENLNHINYFEQQHDCGNYASLGNIEYKLKLIKPTKERITHLITQMKYRVTEGNGEAYYKIGVEDNGRPLGLTKQDMFQSLKTICIMANASKVDVLVLRMLRGIKGLIAQLMVRKHYGTGVSFQIRILLVGGPNVGKSTSLGVLTSGQLDDGKGVASMKVATHKHQLLTGTTQSVSHHLIGFDVKGKLQNKNLFINQQPSLSKVLHFIDIGGHKKAQKQLVSSLCSQFPQYALWVLSSKNPKPDLQQLSLAPVFKMPIIILITHIDLATQQQLKNAVLIAKQTMKKIYPQKIPLVISSMEDVVLISRIISTQDITPIFNISNVTGKNLDLFANFLNLLPSLSNNSINHKLKAQVSEFLVTQKFNLSGNIILGGIVLKGIIKKGKIMQLGPDNKGNFIPIQITGVHCKRVPVVFATCGQTCTVSIKILKVSQQWFKQSIHGIRRGMILADSMCNPKAAYQFLAQIYPYNSKQPIVLATKYLPVVNTLTTRQICKLISSNDEQIKSNKYKLQKTQLKKRNSKSIDQPKQINKSRKPQSKKSIDYTNNQWYMQQQKCKLQQIKEQGYSKKKRKQTIQIKPGVNYLRLRFKYMPEYIKQGQRLVIHDSLLRAYGKISQIYY